jgi:hypothetical protein
MPAPIAAFSPVVRLVDSTLGGGVDNVVVKKTEVLELVFMETELVELVFKETELVEVGPNTAKDGDNDVDDELSLDSIAVGRAPGGNSERSLGFHATLIAFTMAVPGPTNIGTLPWMLPRPFGVSATAHAEVAVLYTEAHSKGFTKL